MKSRRLFHIIALATGGCVLLLAISLLVPIEVPLRGGAAKILNSEKVTELPGTRMQLRIVHGPKPQGYLPPLPKKAKSPAPIPASKP